MKVILFKTQKLQSTADEDDITRIITTIRVTGKVSTGELVKMVNIPRSTLVRKLNELLRQNKIVKSGKGRSVRYSVLA